MALKFIKICVNFNLLYILVKFRAYSFIGRKEIRENDVHWLLLDYIDLVNAHLPYHVT